MTDLSGDFVIQT